MLCYVFRDRGLFLTPTVCAERCDNTVVIPLRGHHVKPLAYFHGGFAAGAQHFSHTPTACNCPSAARAAQAAVAAEASTGVLKV